MSAFLLRVLRKIVTLTRVTLLHTPIVSHINRSIPFGKHHSYSQLCTQDALLLIEETLQAPEPCMIARFGRIEISTLVRIYFMLEKKSLLKKMQDFLLWKNDGFFLETQYILRGMKINAGFFPLTRPLLLKYYNLCLQDIPECNILASWTAEERVFHHLLEKSTFIPFCLGSFLWKQEMPWTRVLEGKKVLVVHPFAQSIEQQYTTKRTKIFPGTQVLPLFDLKVLQAVQSLGDQEPPFETWFDALDHMKTQINKIDFDIALIGCGAYGFNLAAHIKKMGKKAVHMGGDLQYLFGIVGNFLEKNPIWQTLKNDAWIHPSEEERPLGFKKVENGCYW
ncbi:MAG: hypothetical protein ACRCVN_01600 [Spirochaetia bacterium]